jgi:hypothetical protein
MKRFIVFISLITFLLSCEKVINLDLESSQPKLVVEANITDQPGPYFVTLTTSVPFSNTNTYPEVNNATVTIADNVGQTETLQAIGGGRYRTSTLQGIVGRTYTLTIVASGVTYTAKSTMPSKVNLDSLLYRPIKFGIDSQKTVTPKYIDPIAFGNNYRFVLRVNGRLDKNYFVDNDNVNNGRPYDRPLFTNDITIESGNIVTVEMQCVDAQAYQYYFTLAEIQGNGPGGGAAPTNPNNGISNGALGLFSAHTTQSKSIIIP